jgi:hypothetical protein
MPLCRFVLLSGNSTLLDTLLNRKDKRISMNSTIVGVELVGKGIAIEDKMRYKAIIIIEGNDVASGPN